MALSSEEKVALCAPNVVVPTKTNHTITATSCRVSTHNDTIPINDQKSSSEALPTSSSTTTATTGATTAGCTSIGVLNSHTNAHKQNLLFKLGGKEMLKKVVEQFYNHLSSNECEIHTFFQKTNIQMLKWHQYTFLSIAFTNPEIICADNFDIQTTILKRHERMFRNDGLNEYHYDIMMKYLVVTLTEMKIEQIYIDEALGVLLPLRAVFQKGAILAQQHRQERIERDTMIQLTATIVTTTIIVVAVAFTMLHSHRTRR